MKPASVLFLVLLAACTPKSPELPSRLPTQTTPPKADSPAASATPAPMPTPTPRPFDESLLTGKEFLLEVKPVPIKSLDFGLGELGSGPVTDAAAALLMAAQKGGDTPLDVRTLDPRWATYLQGWARRVGKDGLSGTVRIGIPLPEKEGGVMVPVRVVGDKKEWQGWIFLVKSNDVWLISDVQVEGHDRDSSPFNPETPRLVR